MIRSPRSAGKMPHCLRRGRPRRKAAETASHSSGRRPKLWTHLRDLRLLGQHHRAAELFRRAVAARPDVSQYLFNLAATERMAGCLTRLKFIVTPQSR